MSKEEMMALTVEYDTSVVNQSMVSGWSCFANYCRAGCFHGSTIFVNFM